MLKKVIMIASLFSIVLCVMPVAFAMNVEKYKTVFARFVPIETEWEDTIIFSPDLMYALKLFFSNPGNNGARSLYRVKTGEHMFPNVFDKTIVGARFNHNHLVTVCTIDEGKNKGYKTKLWNMETDQVTESSYFTEDIRFELCPITINRNGTRFGFISKQSKAIDNDTGVSMDASKLHYVFVHDIALQSNPEKIPLSAQGEYVSDFAANDDFSYIATVERVYIGDEGWPFVYPYKKNKDSYEKIGNGYQGYSAVLSVDFKDLFHISNYESSAVVHVESEKIMYQLFHGAYDREVAFSKTPVVGGAENNVKIIQVNSDQSLAILQLKDTGKMYLCAAQSYVRELSDLLHCTDSRADNTEKIKAFLNCIMRKNTCKIKENSSVHKIFESLGKSLKGILLSLSRVEIVKENVEDNEAITELDRADFENNTLLDDQSEQNKKIETFAFKNLVKVGIVVFAMYCIYKLVNR